MSELSPPETRGGASYADAHRAGTARVEAVMEQLRNASVLERRAMYRRLKTQFGTDVVDRLQRESGAPDTSPEYRDGTPLLPPAL